MTCGAQEPSLRLLGASFDDQTELRRTPWRACAEEQPLVSDGVSDVKVSS
jgi:hypothetical protein